MDRQTLPTSAPWCRFEFPSDEGGSRFLTPVRDRWVLWESRIPMRLRLAKWEYGERFSVSQVLVEDVSDSGPKPKGIHARDMRDLELGLATRLLDHPDVSPVVLAAVLRTTVEAPALAPADCGLADAIAASHELPTFSLATPLKVEVPTTRAYPDDFYRDVARVFFSALAGSPDPARSIAEANGVETTRVHRWIKEARRRQIIA